MSELISVVIPTYNRSDYVRRAIDSVVAQTYKPVEIIVVDDGSTDDTWEKLQGYGRLIHAIRQPNQGRSAARNHGIEAAKGNFIAFLDSDDFWAPEKLAKEAAALLAHPEAGACYSWWAAVNAQEMITRVFKPTAEGDVFEALFWNNFISPSHILIRRECLLDGGRLRFCFDDSLAAGEDWKLWLQLAMKHRFCRVGEVLVFVTSHGANTFNSENVETIISNLWALEKSLGRDPDFAGRFAGLGKRAQAVWPERRGYFYSRRGHKIKAFKEYLHAIRICPGYLPAYSRLAQLLVGPWLVERLSRIPGCFRNSDRSVIVPRIKKQI